MTVQQHDHFDGSTLGGYWAQDPESSWAVVAGGAVCAAAFGTRSRLVHQTDAAIGLPRSHSVAIRFRGTVGLDEIGVSMLGASKPSSAQRVELVYVVGSLPRLSITVPGLSPFVQIVPPVHQPQLSVAVYHTLYARAIYQGEIGGVPHYRFRLQLNANSIYETPAVPVSGWTSGHVHPGITARRVAGPVTPAGQSIVFVEEFGLDDEIEADLDPAPTFRAQPARAQIEPELVERNNGAPDEIPFRFQLLSVRVPSRDDVHQSDSGHRSALRVTGAARRVFECAFVGDSSMREDVEDWLADEDGAGFGAGNFTATIHSAGIGTVNVAMAMPSIDEWQLIGPGVWSLQFTLWEVFDATANLT